MNLQPLHSTPEPVGGPVGGPPPTGSAPDGARRFDEALRRARRVDASRGAGAEPRARTRDGARRDDLRPDPEPAARPAHPDTRADAQLTARPEPRAEHAPPQPEGTSAPDPSAASAAGEPELASGAPAESAPTIAAGTPSLDGGVVAGAIGVPVPAASSGTVAPLDAASASASPGSPGVRPQGPAVGAVPALDASASSAGSSAASAAPTGVTGAAVLLDEHWLAVDPGTPGTRAGTTDGATERSALPAETPSVLAAQLGGAAGSPAGPVVPAAVPVAPAAAASGVSPAAALVRSLSNQLEGPVRALLAPEGPSRLEIELHPARLGTITLSCRREAGRTEVTVLAHSAGALTALTDAARDLQQRLADTRLQFQVHTGLEARTQGGATGDGQGQPAPELGEAVARPALRLGSRPGPVSAARRAPRATGLDVYL